MSLQFLWVIEKVSEVYSKSPPPSNSNTMKSLHIFETNSAWEDSSKFLVSDSSYYVSNWKSAKLRLCIFRLVQYSSRFPRYSSTQ